MIRLPVGTVALLLTVLVTACGAITACGADEVRDSALEIGEARWRGDTVVVSGTWTRGVSTPPDCRLLEGRDGAVIGRFGLEGANFDGNAFSQELVPDIGQSGIKTGYQVRCSVTLSSARTMSDTALVELPG